MCPMIGSGPGATSLSPSSEGLGKLGEVRFPLPSSIVTLFQPPWPLSIPGTLQAYFCLRAFAAAASCLVFFSHMSAWLIPFGSSSPGLNATFSCGLSRPTHIQPHLLSALLFPYDLSLFKAYSRKLLFAFLNYQLPLLLLRIFI